MCKATQAFQTELKEELKAHEYHSMRNVATPRERCLLYVVVGPTLSLTTEHVSPQSNKLKWSISAQAVLTLQSEESDPGPEVFMVRIATSRCCHICFQRRMRLRRPRQGFRAILNQISKIRV